MLGQILNACQGRLVGSASFRKTIRSGQDLRSAHQPAGLIEQERRQAVESPECSIELGHGDFEFDGVVDDSDDRSQTSYSFFQSDDRSSGVSQLRLELGPLQEILGPESAYPLKHLVQDPDGFTFSPKAGVSS